MRVPESKRALRWEESKISGAAAGRCGFGRPKERFWEGTQESKPLGGTFWVNLSHWRLKLFAGRHRGSPTWRFFGGSPV